MKRSDPDDLERLAAVEHESWGRWSRYMLDTIRAGLRDPSCNHEGIDEFDALECVARWERQIATPYDQLSEKERESDRAVAREKLDAYRLCVTCDPTLAAYLEVLKRRAASTAARAEDADAKRHDAILKLVMHVEALTDPSSAIYLTPLQREALRGAASKVRYHLDRP